MMRHGGLSDYICLGFSTTQRQAQGLALGFTSRPPDVLEQLPFTADEARRCRSSARGRAGGELLPTGLRWSCVGWIRPQVAFQPLATAYLTGYNVLVT